MVEIDTLAIKDWRGEEAPRRIQMSGSRDLG